MLVFSYLVSSNYGYSGGGAVTINSMLNMPFNEVGIVFQLTSWEAELLQFIFLTVVHLKNLMNIV